MPITRREFVRTTSLGGAALGLGAPAQQAHVLGLDIIVSGPCGDAAGNIHIDGVAHVAR